MNFSCIVTCYNRESSIQRAMQSILGQTYQGFELIVIDDASKDNSVAKICEIRDDRIKLIRHDVNKGQNAALNSGILHAKYDYLAFLDSDDAWEPEYLSEMDQTYCQNPDIDFAYCNLINGPLWTLEGHNKYAEVLQQGYLSSMISITAKKSAVEDIGNFDLRYTMCQDDDFCFRLAKKYAFKVIKKPLVRYIGAPDSMTLNKANVATGWEFLFSNYKDDMLSYCGNRAYSKHLLSLAALFFNASGFIKGLYYYFAAVFYFFKPGNGSHFKFSTTDFFRVSRNMASAQYRQTRQLISLKIRSLMLLSY